MKADILTHRYLEADIFITKKRGFLSFAASTFDPPGILAPFAFFSSYVTAPLPILGHY